MHRPAPALAAALLLLASLTVTACRDIEGNEPGECEDGADNDSDTFFDCFDADCAGAPVCQGDDDDAANDDDAADDDDSAGDDDDAADDDDATGDGVTPYIDDVTTFYNPANSTFTFSIEAYDPDNNFGVPLLLWSVDGSPQPPQNVGGAQLQGEAFFDVQLSGATTGQTYQVLFVIQDQDGNQSAGYPVSAFAG